ncbi:LPS translocon maturation chaperone LptM [Kangiella shandongensis]|uniref:LPS translocon maturation chaperone LptM n=1 Tax=Kangiella shandongensis TaxID=2763258 RepID=UPI001CC14EA5|nr:lipoprotein [Kangiella shandongensis]
MKRLRLLGLAGLAVLFLGACGQKGPLRMPDDEPQKQTLVRSPADTTLKEAGS